MLCAHSMQLVTELSLPLYIYNIDHNLYSGNIWQLPFQYNRLSFAGVHFSFLFCTDVQIILHQFHSFLWQERTTVGAQGLLLKSIVIPPKFLDLHFQTHLIIGKQYILDPLASPAELFVPSSSRSEISSPNSQGYVFYFNFHIESLPWEGSFFPLICCRKFALDKLNKMCISYAGFCINHDDCWLESQSG